MQLDTTIKSKEKTHMIPSELFAQDIFYFYLVSGFLKEDTYHNTQILKKGQRIFYVGLSNSLKQRILKHYYGLGSIVTQSIKITDWIPIGYYKNSDRFLAEHVETLLTCCFQNVLPYPVFGGFYRSFNNYITYEKIINKLNNYLDKEKQKFFEFINIFLNKEYLIDNFKITLTLATIYDHDGDVIMWNLTN